VIALITRKTKICGFSRQFLDKTAIMKDLEGFRKKNITKNDNIDNSDNIDSGDNIDAINEKLDLELKVEE
jgi:hypothetical protein